ncbi:hypothetical protein D3C78_1069990 [compost metagenome]
MTGVRRLTRSRRGLSDFIFRFADENGVLVENPELSTTEVEKHRTAIEHIINGGNADIACARAGEGCNDLFRDRFFNRRRATVADAGLQPVFAREGGRFGDALQLFLKLLDFILDLAAVGANAVGGDELGLDLLDDLDRAFKRVVGGVDLGGSQTQSVLHGRKRVIVGAHRRCNGPVGRVIRRSLDTVAGRHARLCCLEALVDHAQGLQRGHRRRIGQNAGHGVHPTQNLRKNPALCRQRAEASCESAMA